MWIVKLTKQPRRKIYRSEYFPHVFRYKKDALRLRAEVKLIGGDAVVEKYTHELN